MADWWASEPGFGCQGTSLLPGSFALLCRYQELLGINSLSGGFLAP